MREFKTTRERREFLEKILKKDLSNIGKVLIDNEKDIHCENLIGAVSLPLGVAGPIKIKNQNYYVPLATTEGALVASVNRGCKAITAEKGAVVVIEEIGVTRGPVFETSGIRESLRMKFWLSANFKKIAATVSATSSHITLTRIETQISGNRVFVRFYFNTQDAMGMNMATIATTEAVRFIEKEVNVKCIAVAGNFDIDKKPAWLNFLGGRGKKVWAEAIITRAVIKDVLKTTPEKIYKVWLSKCLLGAAMSGSLGFNSHFANIVAAYFAATGQDLAHIVEGSMGITTTKIIQDNNLYISIYLPAVMVGTVGGGTKLKTQTEARSIIGVQKSHELAEVLGGAVLAGELSLLAALAEGSLAKAHQRLGR